MSNQSEAFFAGIYDGVSHADGLTKSAEAFMSGMKDSLRPEEPSIMDKIAAAVEAEVEEEVEAEDQSDEITAQGLIHGLINGDFAAE